MLLASALQDMTLGITKANVLLTSIDISAPARSHICRSLLIKQVKTLLNSMRMIQQINDRLSFSTTLKVALTIRNTLVCQWMAGIMPTAWFLRKNLDKLLLRSIVWLLKITPVTSTVLFLFKRKRVKTAQSHDGPYRDGPYRNGTLFNCTETAHLTVPKRPTV